MYINNTDAQTLCANSFSEHKSVFRPLDVVGAGFILDSGARIYKAGAVGYGVMEVQIVLKRPQTKQDGRIVVVSDRDSLALDASNLVAACGGVASVSLSERGYANMFRGILQSYKTEDLVYGRSLKLTLTFKGEAYSSYNTFIWQIGGGDSVTPTGSDYNVLTESYTIPVDAKFPSPARVVVNVRRKTHGSLLPQVDGMPRITIEGLSADVVTREPSKIYLDGYCYGVKYTIDGFTGELSRDYAPAVLPMVADMPMLYPGMQEFTSTGITAGSVTISYRAVAV